jgi:threonine/homoserine/homoserine lactone efflux protein
MNFASLILRGSLLGLGAAVPIGPVNVEISRRTLRGGFLAGFALGCGAVTVDVCYAVLSSLGFGLLLNRPLFYWPLSIGGIALLTYLGVMCWAGAVRAMRPTARLQTTKADGGAPAGGDPILDYFARGPAEEAAGVSALIKTSPRAGYITGLLMTLLNPMTLGFWFVAVPGVVAKLSQRPGRDLPIICGGVFLGTIGWVVGFAGTLSVTRRWQRAWWVAAADAFGGTMLLAFAGLLVWRTKWASLIGS